MPLENFASYVPIVVAERFKDGRLPEAPTACVHDAAVIFADISGFTALTEFFVTRGPSGVEELTRCLSKCFGLLIDVIADHGGDIVKFAGDSLLAVWPEFTGELPERCCRAAQCGLAAHKLLHDFDAGADVRLSLRIGIGAGPITIFVVGGVDGRWEVVASGTALNQMSAAKDQAKPGDVVVSAETWELLAGRMVGEELADGARRLLEVRDPVVCPRLEPHDSGNPALLAFLPISVADYVRRGSEDWLFAELRRISVIFINFPGLTSETPVERAQKVMIELQNRLYRYEGTIDKISVDDKGASMIAVMGLPPLAHEDDPVRAVRVAFEICASLRALGVRHGAGIATGRAFCGVIGNARRREYTVIGDVVNLAARLMQSARDELICDQATFEAARSKISFERLPRLKVKGKAETVSVYRAHDAPPAETRIEALVGRTAEKEIFAEKLRRLTDEGLGSAIVLEGEAGMGKSTLIADFVSAASTVGVRCLVSGGEAAEKSTPWYAWRKVFDGLFDLEEGAPAEKRHESITATIGRPGVCEHSDLLALLNALLGTDFAETEASAAMAPRARAAALFDLLVEILAERPQVVVLDDAHWMDSASWTLARQVRLRHAPVLLIVSMRPMGAQAPEELLDIQHTPGTEWLILDALPPEDTVQIACQALGVAELPEEVAALIRVRSAGSPLFCQELAFAVRETGLIRIENGVCSLARDLGDLSAIDLPGTVDSAIIARIDRLSPSQRMGLKVASVIGRVFSAEALESLYPFRSDSPLENDLSSLAALRIIVREQSQAKETYYFSHMLIRDVAYSLMLYSQRRQLHQGMAERLEQSHAANLESVYALLAYHWSRAAPEDGSEPKAVWKAVTYLQKAGEQALRQYIVRDAITLLSDALRILGRLPEDEARDRKELELQCALGGLLIASRGFAAPETEQAFSQGWELGRKLKDAPEFYGALGGLWNISVIRGQLARARELAREMLQFAEAIPTGELLVSSNRAVGETAFWRGELDDAQLHLRRCLALYRPEQHAIEAFRTGQDPAVVAHGFLSWTLWLTGFPDQALAEIDQGLALAESLKHPFSVAMMLQFYSMLHYYRREPELAKEKSAKLIELAQKEGFALWIQSALMINGWARAEEGEIEEGIVDIQRGLAGYRATGAMLPVPFCLSMLADTLGRAGRVGEGLAVIAEALDLSYGNEEGWWRAELHHVQAKLLLAMSASNRDAADSELRQAMSVASKQNARSLELRAATSLSRLMRR